MMLRCYLPLAVLLLEIEVMYFPGISPLDFVALSADPPSSSKAEFSRKNKTSFVGNHAQRYSTCFTGMHHSLKQIIISLHIFVPSLKESQESPSEDCILPRACRPLDDTALIASFQGSCWKPRVSTVL